MKVVINKVDQNNFVAFINRLRVIDSFVYFKIKDEQKLIVRQAF